MHRPTFGLRVLKAILVFPLSLLFGKRRGARAARRLLFELSWRVAGAKTYRASGWPGRLFYRES
jgi:spore maturation protein CgeB